MDVFVCGVLDKKQRLQLIQLRTRHLGGCFEVPLKKISRQNAGGEEESEPRGRRPRQPRNREAAEGGPGHQGDEQEAQRSVAGIERLFCFYSVNKMLQSNQQNFFFCPVPGTPWSVVGRREAQSLHGRAGVGETGQGGRPV